MVLICVIILTVNTHDYGINRKIIALTVKLTDSCNLDSWKRNKMSHSGS